MKHLAEGLEMPLGGVLTGRLAVVERVGRTGLDRAKADNKSSDEYSESSIANK